MLSKLDYISFFENFFLKKLSSSWCGPCKMLGMKLEETFAAKARKFKVVKVPVDENEYTEKLSEEHGVNKI